MADTAVRRSINGSPVSRPAWPEAAMFPAGVLAVHELRYVLAYGSHAGRELTAHGDTYVGSGALVAGLLLVVPISALVIGVRRARRGLPGGRLSALAPWQSWLAWSLLLIAGFVALEGIEMIFESEHPDGFAGVFGGGGWWAAPAAGAVAALFTLLRRGARALVRRVARRWCERPLRAATSVSLPRAAGRGRRPRPAPLAGRAAGRAPPHRQALQRFA
ncbi:MAG TPA: hypothetical protein VIJ51_10625 [Solirubrobacteraceae bacterium]